MPSVKINRWAAVACWTVAIGGTLNALHPLSKPPQPPSLTKRMGLDDLHSSSSVSTTSTTFAFPSGQLVRYYGADATSRNEAASPHFSPKGDAK